MAKLPNLQQRTYNELIKKIVKHDSMAGQSEIKDIYTNVSEFGTMYVFIETGHPADEGTLASILCRSIRRFFIGKRGGLRNENYKRTTIDKLVMFPQKD